MENMIRLYGSVRGNSSWARVLQGAMQGLKSCQRLAGVFDIETIDYDDNDCLSEGWNAEIGILIGPPAASGIMIGRGKHRHRLLMVAANSTWLPGVIMARAKDTLTGFLVPSEWSREVVESYQKEHLSELPIILWHHGVDDGFRPSEEKFYERYGVIESRNDVKVKIPQLSFRVLHLSSSCQQRKGTFELLEAWSGAIKNKLIPEDSQLLIVQDGSRGYLDPKIFQVTKGEIKVAESISVVRRLDFNTEEMRRLMLHFHVVCQPSRAEGFGLVPLEARACGVPVIVTKCTGHEEHVGNNDPGVVLVDHGIAEEIDDGPGAYAPSLSVQDITNALGEAYELRFKLLEDANRNAEVVRERWSWPRVTERMLKESRL